MTDLPTCHSGEFVLDLRTADAVSNRYRQTCTNCGKRRVCTDYVWLGTIPGRGVSLCDECSVAALSGRNEQP